MYSDEVGSIVASPFLFGPILVLSLVDCYSVRGDDWMWNFVGVILGITIFLVGLRVMSRSLTRVGAKFARRLERATKNRYQAFAVGFFVTAVIHSSSVVNVMTVGLVNSGLLGLEQAFAIMLGANVGTTMTAQLIALPVADYGLYLIVLGVFLRFVSRSHRLRTWSSVIVGTGAVFYGLLLMQHSLAQLGQWATQTLPKLNPIGGPAGWILVGIVLTGIIQSSSVVTGLTIALVQANLLPGFEGVCIALGSNIGTVATTLIASIGLSLAARKAALADLIFNVLGVMMIYPFLYMFYGLIRIISPTPAVEIANAHTFFNLFTAGLALPFLPSIVRKMGGNAI